MMNALYKNILSSEYFGENILGDKYSQFDFFKSIGFLCVLEIFISNRRWSHNLCPRIDLTVHST